ncbi:MAG: hypothetical protein D6824_01940 [Planctomycetota bacterium]|nr:MAG: hypothetical protein D6824_01940 [Planctomycetota bacterium]
MAVALRDERWQPFPGLYSAALLSTVRTHLAQGRRSLAPLLEAHALAVPVQPGALLDVNMPADLDRAKMAIDRRC